MGNAEEGTREEPWSLPLYLLMQAFRLMRDLWTHGVHLTTLLRLVKEFPCTAACGKMRKAEGRAKSWKGLRKQGRHDEVKRKDKRYDVETKPQIVVDTETSLG